MSESLYDFYRASHAAYHEIVPLHQIGNLSWEEIHRKIPLLPKGWFELTRLSKEDRIDFTRAFWLSKLPFIGEDAHSLEERISGFFELIEDIEIFATQEREKGPFEAHMIYSLKDDSSFFHGYPGASIETIENFTSQFGHFTFPPDYLAFLEIHDGFSKFTDTGLIRTRDMSRIFLKFQEMMAEEKIILEEEKIINTNNLIPFYEAFGLHSYQCFCREESPGSPVHNLYYSDQLTTLGEFLSEKSLDVDLTFPTFLAWLSYYLEDVGYVI